MRRYFRKSGLRELLSSVMVLIIAYAALEAAVRTTYIVRNAFVDAIILPYTVGGDYGPVPPWIDDLRS